MHLSKLELNTMKPRDHEETDRDRTTVYTLLEIADPTSLIVREREPRTIDDAYQIPLRFSAYQSCPMLTTAEGLLIVFEVPKVMTLVTNSRTNWTALSLLSENGNRN